MLLFANDATAYRGPVGASLTVSLVNAGDTPVTVAGFSIGLTGVPTEGITFTGVTTDTLPLTYLFASRSLFGPDITTPRQMLPGSVILASDRSLDPGGFTIPAYSNVGLGRAFFDVASSAPLDVVLAHFLEFPNSSLSDASGNDIAIGSFNDSSIRPGATPVPEPASGALIGTALALLGASVRWRCGRKQP